MYIYTPGICPCIRPVFTFYVKVLREVFFIHQEMALAGGIRAPLGTCSSQIITILVLTSIATKAFQSFHNLYIVPYSQNS